MENSQIKKPNKYVALATYLVAVICLLLGLFLPLFDGKNILALQLPDVIKQISNKESNFNLAYYVDFFGLGKFNVDIMAWVIMLYAVITALSLLALIPIGISTKRGTGTARIFMYAVETAAVLVLSIYVIIALMYQNGNSVSPSIYIPLSNFCYNMLIALAGSLLMLIALSLLCKKGTGFAKLVLFLLSAVGLLALYDISLIIPKLANLKLPSALYGTEISRVNGIGYIDILFNGNYKELFATAADAKSKAAMVFCTALALLALINYFIDVLSLSTNAKRAGHGFNLLRYGLEIVLAICLLITVAICKYEIGLMLIILAVVAFVQIEISLARFLIFRKKAKKAKEAAKREADEQVIVEHVQHRRTEPYHRPTDHSRRPAEHTHRPAEPYRRPAEPVRTAPVKPEREQPLQMEIVDIVEPEPVLMEEPERVQPKRTEPKPVREDKAEYEQHAQNTNPVYTPHPAKNVNKVYEARITPDEEYDPHTTKPVTASQPAGETRIYTINTIYGGPVDDFIRKLTNDEKIEFAMTFIEKSKGNVGNIPEYAIGGDNRKFFSAVFIYLGRIRGLISDGLLNKMYKELNML